MELFIIIVAVVIFSVLFYGVLPKNISIFRRFDFLFRTIFIFLLIGRIFWIFSINNDIVINWAFSPFVINSNAVEVFNSLPWLVFRFWDGYWLFPGYMISVMVSIFVGLLSSRVLRLKFEVINKLLITVFVSYSITLLLQGVLKQPVFLGGIDLFNWGFSFSQLAINLLIFLLVVVGIIAFKMKNASPLIIFSYGITHLLASLVSGTLDPTWLETNINLFEAGILIILGLGYFLYSTVHASLRGISIEGLDVLDRSEHTHKRKRSIEGLYKGQSWNTRKWE